MKNLLHPLPRLGTLVLACGLALGASMANAESAVPGQAPAPQAGQRTAPRMDYGHGYHHGFRHHAGQFDERGMRGLARLHDELKLDARQESLWTDAANAGREARNAMREQMRKQHEETRAALSQPGADLRAIVKRMNEVREDARKQHEAIEGRWLALYDALSPEQKEKARVFFKTMFERGERRLQGPRAPQGGRVQPGPRSN